MGYVEGVYIINEEGMIVEEIDEQDDHTLNKKANPQSNDLMKCINEQIQRADSDQA